jgi:hypothetical protein
MEAPHFLGQIPDTNLAQLSDSPFEPSVQLQGLAREESAPDATISS